MGIYFVDLAKVTVSTIPYMVLKFVAHGSINTSCYIILNIAHQRIFDLGINSTTKIN